MPLVESEPVVIDPIQTVLPRISKSCVSTFTDASRLSQKISGAMMIGKVPVLPRVKKIITVNIQIIDNKCKENIYRTLFHLIKKSRKKKISINKICKIV